MKAHVSSREYQDNGNKRIYTLTDGSVVIEYPNQPGKSRFNFFDSRGNSIHKNQQRVAMKQAVEHHKKQWRVKP